MKKRISLAAVVVLLFSLVANAFAAKEPVVLKPVGRVVVERDHTMVRVVVPKGIRTVRVEVREGQSTTWQTRLTTIVNGNGGKLRLRLNSRIQPRNLRVVGDPSPTAPQYFEEIDTALSFISGSMPRLFATLDGEADGGQTAPTLEESDIWKVRGNSLYFFNQYRGLQIIDISNPDDPALVSQLRLPAVGEEMYLLGDRHVVLLTHGWGMWSGRSESQVLLVDVGGKQPRIVGRLPVRGWTVDSRMVGSRLYVASSFYSSVDSDGHVVYENGTEVASFDLADPEHPVVRGTLQFDGSNHVVAADVERLFVVSFSWSDGPQSVVHVVDISDPTGELKEGPSIAVAGYVADKFKLHRRGNVLTCVSQVWQWDPASNRNVQYSRLENFDLANAGKLLGTLDLGKGERLYATRFEGERGYVVTFFQVDPLWVLDLADPAAPRVVGHLEVPGFSNYIHPLGDRLVTIGYVDWKTAVSLFDVSDPANPATLDQLVVSTDWTWSEAQYNEKAFKVLPDAGLILLPLSGCSNDGYASQVQLIDLNRDALVKRGVIHHRMQARRAAMEKGRVLTISATELLSVDVSDRDQPVVTADVRLAWPVDRVVIAGRHLLQIADGDCGRDFYASLTVTSLEDTETALNEIELGAGRVVGATLKDSKLYIATIENAADAKVAESADGQVFTTLILDVSALPDVKLLGTASGRGEFGWVSDFDAHWPAPSTLVWAARPAGGWWRPWVGPIFGRPVEMLAAARPDAPSQTRNAAGITFTRLPFPRWNEKMPLVAFNVADPVQPQFASILDLGDRKGWARQDFSRACAVKGAVFVSHRRTLFIAYPLPRLLNELGEMVVREDDWRPGTPMVTCHYLETIDYSDATQPVIGDAINVPGKLAGVADNGTVLFTEGYGGDKRFAVQASAYDGASASLLDSVKIEDGWENGVAISGRNLFAITGHRELPVPARPLKKGFASITFPEEPVAQYSLQTWRFSDANKFVALGNTNLDGAPSEIHLFGDLAVAADWRSLELLNVKNPALPTILRQAQLAAPSSNLENADGGLGTGLYVPEGMYGVEFVSDAPAHDAGL